MFHTLKTTLIALLVFVPMAGTRAGAAPLVIATDIPPVAAIARAITGRHAVVRQLIPLRMTSHEFTLKPSDITTIQAADLVVWMGPQATPGLTKLLAQDWAASKSIALNLLADTRHLPLRKTGLFAGVAPSATVSDPHTWLDPENAIYWANIITARLAQLDPENSGAFNAGRDRLIAEIRATKADIKTQFSQVRAKPFVQYHDAFHYFERAFGLKALGAATNVSEETSSLGIIAKLQGALARTTESCVFVPADQQAKRANALIALKGVTPLVLDALGRNMKAESYDYPALLKMLGNTYVGCFSVG